MATQLAMLKRFDAHHYHFDIWVFCRAVIFSLCCPGDSTQVNVKWIVRLGLSLPCWLIDSPVNTTAGKIYKACKCYLNIRSWACVFTRAWEALKVLHNILLKRTLCKWTPSIIWEKCLGNKCVFLCLISRPILTKGGQKQADRHFAFSCFGLMKMFLVTF